MTPDDLRKICPYSSGKAEMFVSALTSAMQEFTITTARRQAAFIAQVAHETMEFRYLREIASGADYEPNTERGKELGNTQPGDGPRFKGGGGLMLTGRANFDSCGKALGINLIDSPSLIEVPAYAMRSAGWFWNQRGLNELADRDRFFDITHRINGGYNHGDERLAYYLVARKVLGL